MSFRDQKNLRFGLGLSSTHLVIVSVVAIPGLLGVLASAGGEPAGGERLAEPRGDRPLGDERWRQRKRSLTRKEASVRGSATRVAGVVAQRAQQGGAMIVRGPWNPIASSTSVT